MALDNSILNTIRQMMVSNESYKDSFEQSSIVKEVLDNINVLTETTPQPSPEDIICYIGEHHIEYASREYFGHVLVLDYKVNPFEIYAIVSSTDLWHINQYFGTTFSVCDSTPYLQIKETLKHLSCLENISVSVGSFISSIASYYKTHLDEYDDLITNYISSPLDYLEGLCDYGLDYLMKANHRKGLDYIKQLQDADSLILNNLAAHMLIHVVDNYLCDAANHVKKAIDHLQTIDYSAASNQPFIRNCQALLIASYRNTVPEDVRKKINKLIYDTADRSEEAHYILSHEIALDIHKPDKEIQLNIPGYLQFVANVNTLNNTSTIDNIDFILAWSLEHLPADLVWPCIIAVGSQNKCSRLERLDSTLYEITKNISKHLPFIYSNILSSSSMHNVGLKVLQDLSFHDGNDYSSIEWSGHMPSEKRVDIANKVFLSCIHPKFLLQWGILFAHGLDEEVFPRYNQLYISLVCENYLHTALEQIPKLSLHNPVQVSLQEIATAYCKKRIDELKSVRQIPDFAPSHARQRLYRIEQHKQTTEIQKKAESKSIFADLITTVHMKYGARSAHLMRGGDNAILEERNYMTFSMELELPYTALYDPQTYYFNVSQVFREDDSE